MDAIEITRGSTVNWTMTATDSADAPINLTGATLEVFEQSFTGTVTVTIQNAAGGIIAIQILDAVTSAFEVGVRYSFRIRITWSATSKLTTPEIVLVAE